MGILWYATREDVKSALDMMETARNDAQVDRANDAAFLAINSLTHRRFYPEVATRYFDWPNFQYAQPWRLWLDSNDLISATTVTSGGTAVSSTDYFLRRSDDRDEPPYRYVEIDLGSSSAWSGGSTTPQRSIVINGLWGYGNDETPAGSLAEALDISETGVDVTDSYTIGVGSIIRVDSERMIVTGKAMLTTGQSALASLTAVNSDVLVSVTTGSAFTIGEVILLDAERMKIVDIAGNSLIVKRAWDGTVLATHTTPTIYAPRTLIVRRGALGTSATAHDTATAIYRHDPAPGIRELAVAEAATSLIQEGSGWARTAGQGDNARETLGRGLIDLRNQARDEYALQARTMAI